MKVLNIRYWETRRGIGYEAVTDFGGTIWNDGDGGGTYLMPTWKKEGYLTNAQLHDLLPNDVRTGLGYENFLDNLVNIHEGQPLL
jgi:hypothetical protein